MKRLASIVFSIALVGAGTVVGWEAKNWQLVISEWYIKAGAYDFVGNDVMSKIMVEVAKKRIEHERAQAPQKLQLDAPKSLPAYPPKKRGEVRA